MGIAYLATPYSRYSDGIDAAFREAAKLAAQLIKSGLHVYAPIVHCHPIAEHGGIDPLDQTFWTEFDAKMLALCDTLIVAHMDGWEQSSGIAHEIEFFVNAGKSVFDLDVSTLRMEKRR